MRVAIVGGGIGGCTLALSLHAAGILDVSIHEASGAPRELGVGINLLPHAVRELDELGIAARLAAAGVPTGELSYHNRFGEQIVAPRSIIAWVKSPGRRDGTSVSARARISDFAAGNSASIAKSRAITRSMLPSTATARRPNAMAAIAAAV